MFYEVVNLIVEAKNQVFGKKRILRVLIALKVMWRLIEAIKDPCFSYINPRKLPKKNKEKKRGMFPVP